MLRRPPRAPLHRARPAGTGNVICTIEASPTATLKDLAPAGRGTEQDTFGAWTGKDTDQLGCVLPGESPAAFGDALRRLAAATTYLYQDGPRYWYDTRPTVTKLAEDRAEQLRRDPDRVTQAIGVRLRAALNDTGGFSRIHTAPRSGHDVPDERETRLVVLGIEHPHRRDPGSAAETAATTLLESRGTTPRLYRNTLVFLAPDQTRLQDLDEAARHHLAWESILAEREVLDARTCPSDCRT